MKDKDTNIDVKGMSNLENATSCPKCKSSWDGGSILESFLQLKKDGHEYYKDKTVDEIKELVILSYSPPYRFGRQIGIELPYDHPNYYDGISYWQCPDCQTTFNRFTGREEEI